MGDGHQTGARTDGLQHRLRVQIAIGIHIHPFQHHALAFAQEMPGHDVGVVLHDRQHNLVPRLQARRSPAIGHQIDAFGRARGEDNLVFRTGVQEARDLAAHRLVLVGRQIGKVMQAPVNVCIFHRIGLGDRIDHAARLLRGGPVVQIDQRGAVHLAREDGKILADQVNIIRDHGAGISIVRATTRARPKPISRISTASATRMPTKVLARDRKPCNSATKLVSNQKNRTSPAK